MRYFGHIFWLPWCYGWRINAIMFVPSATGYVISGNSTLSHLSSHFSRFKKCPVMQPLKYWGQSYFALIKQGGVFQVCLKTFASVKGVGRKKECYTDGDFIKQQGKLIKGITLLSLPSGPEHRWVYWHQKDFKKRNGISWFRDLMSLTLTFQFPPHLCAVQWAKTTDSLHDSRLLLWL